MREPLASFSSERMAEFFMHLVVKLSHERYLRIERSSHREESVTQRFPYIMFCLALVVSSGLSDKSLRLFESVPASSVAFPGDR